MSQDSVIKLTLLSGLASKLAAAQGSATAVSNFSGQGAAAPGQGGYVRSSLHVTRS